MGCLDCNGSDTKDVQKKRESNKKKEEQYLATNPDISQPQFERNNEIKKDIKIINNTEITNSHNKNLENVEKNDGNFSQDKTIQFKNCQTSSYFKNKSVENANNGIKGRTNDNKTNFHQKNNTTSENKTNMILLNQTKDGHDNTFYEGKDDKNIIGGGSFGLVVKETIKYKDENGNNKVVACKYLNSKNLDKKEKIKFLMNFFREAGSMVNLFYKNIVRLISIHSSNSKLVMEFMEGGDLTKVIYKNKNLSLYFKVYCLFQICDGLKFLHDRQIIHGDLKSLNILLDKKYDGGDNYPTLKLTDFGLSGIKEDISPYRGYGTPGFSAPELYKENPIITTKSDIYSFGVVIYEIFKGESPNINRNKINSSIFYPLPDINKEKWPEEIKKLISKCCKENSEERPSTEEIKKELSDYCNNTKDKKLIEVKNKAIMEVNFNVVSINDFACKLFEEIKSVSAKKYGEFIYKVNDSPYTGFGHHIFEDGTKYIGTFENGKMNKYGIFFYSNGIKYNGEHLNGVWNGKGIFNYKNGFVSYRGKFKFFAFDEFGIISTIQMNKGKIIGKHEYIGQFKEGKQNGIGIYTDPEGRKYSGEWKNGNFGGIGKFDYPDGEVCEGEFEKGIRQGFCHINYTDGSFYEGHCDKGRFNGYGKFFIKEGEIYEGKWKDGCPIEDNKLKID